MEVRRIIKKDIPKILEMGRLMFEESAYNSLEYSPERCVDLCNRVIEDKSYLGIVVLDGETICGMLGAYIGMTDFTEDLIANDILIYVLPEYRGTAAFPWLFRYFMKWAGMNGAKLMLLGTSAGINPGAVGRLYQKYGFTPVGGIYRKEV